MEQLEKREMGMVKIQVGAELRLRRPFVVNEEIAREAYREYRDLYGDSQSFEELHERGGFFVTEIIAFLYMRCRRLETGTKIRFPPVIEEAK